MPLLSIQDIFHKYLEERGIPTWQEFRAHLLEKDMQNVFLKPWWATLVSELDAYDNDHIKDAITWRVGCMYYSAMRELHFISRMRERHGIQLKYHIFADVRLRTDFWIDTNNISLFLSNSSYRSGKKTRKKTAKDILSDRNPKLYFHEVEFSNQYDRGNLYMINDKEIDKLADALVR